MKFLFLLTTLLLCISSQAESSKTINYSGQNGDALELDIINTVTRYREEDQDSTCTRQIPYETEECGYETRYRQECRQVPGRDVCRTEYETRCRTVTRYRRECRRGPDRQVCRDTPPRQVCRNGECRTVPGRRVCDTRPGQEVCRQVPYQDRECTREPRRVCDWEPGRNVCSQVPYQEWICRMVTRYRDETYPCRRTVRIPYTFDRKVSSSVNINYVDDAPRTNVDFEFIIDEMAEVTVRAKDNSRKPVLISMKKVTSRVDMPDSSNSSVNFDFAFFDREKEFEPIKKAIQGMGLSSNAAWFTTGYISKPERIKVALKIVRDGPFSGAKTLFDKTLTHNQLSFQQVNGGTKLLIDLSKYGVSLKDKKHEVTVEVSLNFEDEIINRTREPLTRRQNFEIKVN
ncbi:MAG: hypothetical protein K9K67_02305 [Bacteriovoracaceae bacterium]|nr:hypothetical protein [Bacteriovoracaceae bacterium]